MKSILHSPFTAGLLCALVTASTGQTQNVQMKTPVRRVSIAVTVNGEDGPGVPGVAITIKGPKGTYPGTTGSDGKTSIEVPFISRAEYWVTAKKPGYEAGDHLVVMARVLDSKTVDAPVIVLKRKAGALVSFTVKKEGSTLPVREAHIRVRDSIYAIADDYYKTTNNDGVALLQLPGPGTYPLFIDHQSFESYEGKIEIKAGEDTKSVNIALKEKASDRTITVTVLAGDAKNARGGNEPIRGAKVTGGQGTGVTDSNGIATLAVRTYAVDAGDALGWAEVVDVTVSANNYKSQTKPVRLQKQRLGLPPTASETFTLERGEDPASDATPIKILVEVRDSIGPVVLAKVSLGSLGTAETDGKGERTFESGNLGADALAKLRNGIPITVTHTGHKIYDKVIPADLLKPSMEVRRYSVQLDEDWDPLSKALTSVEEQIAAWKSQAQVVTAKAQAVAALSTKSADARRRGESLLGELKAARKAADAKRPESACKEAKELEKSLLKWKEDAIEREKLLRSTLDEAIGLAATCKSKADADTIRAKQKTALALTAELGRLEKQALEDNKALARLIQNFPDPKPTIQLLQQFVARIEQETSAAGKDAAAAENGFDAAVNLAKTLPGRQPELLKVYDQMRADYHVREYLQVLPRDIRKRLDNLEATLGPTGNDVSMSVPPSIDRSRLKIVLETLTVLEEYKLQAVEIVDEYSRMTCDVQPLDYIVEILGDIMSGVTFELGAAGDLLGKAEACAAKAAGATASPTPVSDEIEVPDVSGFNDPGAMKAAAGPDMIGVLVATKQAPPPGTTRLFAYQDPPAHSKAKRGSTLKIFIYQTLTATPTPTPLPSASVAKDEVVVPDISKAAGNDVNALKAAAGPDMVGVIVATKATPPPGNTKLFASQDPPANSKAKRGSVLKIFVYQSVAEPSATPSPTASASPSPTPTASPSATPATGTMPNLIGLTLEQAVARVPAGMRVYGVEMGAKPPKPEMALTIFAQTPAAGTKYDPKNPPVISVKIYGEATVAPPPVTSSDVFVGTWFGKSFYNSDKDPPVTLFIRKDEAGALSIWVEGRSGGYPLETDGRTKLWHTYGLSRISYELVGNTLQGTCQETTWDKKVATKHTTLQRK